MTYMPRACRCMQAAGDLLIFCRAVLHYTCFHPPSCASRTIIAHMIAFLGSVQAECTHTCYSNQSPWAVSIDLVIVRSTAEG